MCRRVGRGGFVAYWGGLRADYQLISGLNFGSLQDGDKFENQGCFAPDADLTKHIAQMGADGIIFDVQLPSDLLVIEAFAYQFRDLNFSRRQMPAFAKIVPLFIFQNHSSSPSMLKYQYITYTVPMLHVQNATTSLPHIHTSKDYIELVVLLISQKDYEHYTTERFDCKFFLLLGSTCHPI
jgi:hypothetical protein